MKRYCTLLLLAGVLAAAPVRAESLNSQFLAGLRERHLYRLAEHHGRQRWERSDLSDVERAELAVDLALVYTDQALAAAREPRDAQWVAADGICAEFAERWPQNPRRLLVAVQRALVSLARGQQLRDGAVDAAGSQAATAQAIDFLRAAVRQLNDAATAVERELVEVRLRPDSDRPRDALSVNELESLTANISLQLARAQRQLGLCYRARSPDRDDALLQAVRRLTPLADRQEADALVWSARVELAGCQRELGHLQAEIELLDAWAKQNPPRDIAARLAAERVRLLLAAGRIPQALEAANQALTNDHRADGELALARLEASLAALQASRQAGHNADVRGLVAEVEKIRSECGPYWAQRAQLLVGGALAHHGEQSDDVQALLMTAEHQFFNQQYDRALANYDRAISLLTDARQTDQAFAVAMTAAAIEQQAGRADLAAERYRRIALDRPNHSRAAEAHRLAILCVAQLLRASTADDASPQSTSYKQLLDEHLERWPQGATAAEVRMWKAQWLLGRGDWQAAIAAVGPIDAAAPGANDAVNLLVACYEAELRRLDGQTGDDFRRRRIELLAAATQQLQPLITGADNRWPDAWSNLQRGTALALSRMHLQYSDEPSEYAERLLTASLHGKSADADAEGDEAWRAAAQSLLVAALARNGRAEQARELVAQLATGPPAELLELLTGIDALAAGLSPAAGDDRQALGRLALEVARLLDARRNELDRNSAARLEAYRATALSAVGDRAAALAQYAELAAQAPDDGVVQERFAALLAQGDSPDELRQAAAQWQRVEQRSRRGGPRWRRARQARIELLARSGDQTEADKLLRLTRLLYPNWNPAQTPQ